MKEKAEAKEPEKIPVKAVRRVKMPTLRACLQARKPEVINFLEKFCTKGSDLFWYKKSKVKRAVTLVCHIDTSIGDVDRVWDNKAYKYVDTPIRRRIFFDKKQQVFLGPDGLGADDRAGLFGLLRVHAALPEELRPNLLFCDGEETGGHGAKAAAKKLPELQDSLFMVELDRRGINDCVFYNQEPTEFVKYIEDFGFKKDWGTFSDISHIGKEFGICTVNLSVGYFNEHTRYETLYCRFLNETIKKTIELVAHGMREQKEWRLPPPVRATGFYRWGEEYGCRGRQRQLGFGPNRKRTVYTEEEMERHPYLRELDILERAGMVH